MELFGLLLHPMHWAEVDELTADERIVVALIGLGLTMVLAWVAGQLLSRWARLYAARSSGGVEEPAIARIRRGLVVLVLFVGGYWSLEVAPLPRHAKQVLSGIAFVLAAVAAARITVQLTELLLTTSVARTSGLERQRLEREYVPLVRKIYTVAISLVVIIVALKHFGQDVTSLVAALGVGSLAIGLAAQQTLGNMIAGFTLLVDRPFRPSDRIRLASGEVGEVVEVGVRSTRILLGDRDLLIVPNTELVNSRVVNLSRPTPRTQVDVRFTFAYGSNVDELTSLLLEALAEETSLLHAPAPIVRVSALNPIGIELQIAAEVAGPGEVGGAEDRLRRRVLRRCGGTVQFATTTKPCCTAEHN